MLHYVVFCYICYITVHNMS